MGKYLIIFLIIFIIINLILLIPLEIRIIKRINRPILFKILLFNKTLFQKTMDDNKKPPSRYKFKLSHIFDTDLNEILKELKEENIFISMMLENAIIEKITIIPTFNSANPQMIAFFGFMDWMLVATIKRYIDNTFKYVNNEYYQIILLKEDTQGLNFEICSSITLFNILMQIIKNHKVFLKTIKKKENKYE